MLFNVFFHSHSTMGEPSFDPLDRVEMTWDGFELS